MKFHQIIQDYFTFSRNERRGITILLIVIFFLSVANKIIFYFEEPASINVALIDSLKRELNAHVDSVAPMDADFSLFVFNPNTIDSIDLVRLDLPVGIKRNFLKFRRKGGRIYTKADFRKIYGMSDSVFNKIVPYIQLDNNLKSEKSITLQDNLFRFNPNLASNSDFTGLGLTERQISNIRKYQQKGGQFRTKEDLFKIYGFSEEQKKRLSDYVVLDELTKISRQESIKFETVLIDINTADTTQLKLLPGIGSTLSKRIIKYRELIGGFYSVKQLTEIYGLKESTLLGLSELIRVDTTKIRKLNLNFADLNEISRHPYLTKNQAVKILKYRTKNGSFHHLSVLYDSMILNIDEYRRIKPYFSEQK
ncbi:MAG: helix-hairpin-helix domain-containing protein [Prolixibacteraceae bacterium]